MFWGPLAYAMMGGILVATVLTILVLPAGYALFFGREPKKRGAAEPTDDLELSQKADRPQLGAGRRIDRLRQPKRIGRAEARPFSSGQMTNSQLASSITTTPAISVR